ncbi:thiamine diphosphokinase [Maritalea sp.]|uniref:thiamine diphosphokinase n=1 Tax=Maritalea sp. TaxID=2003361 RepID=UPI003EF54FD6
MKNSHLQAPQLSNPDIVLLRFLEPVIVLGGGNFCADQLRSFIAKGYPLIAADGAADAALALGLELKAVIGDLDSIQDRDAFDDDAQVFEMSDQETTDFEKCLYTIDAPLFICFGMLGKRVDHTLAAFHTIARHGVKKHIVLMDDVDITLGVVGDFELGLPVGTRFSIYPLQPVTFERSIGLKYPLDGLTLDVGKRIGTSNEVNKTSVKLMLNEQHDVPYLVILPKDHFDAILPLYSI